MGTGVYNKSYSCIINATPFPWLEIAQEKYNFEIIYRTVKDNIDSRMPTVFKVHNNVMLVYLKENPELIESLPLTEF